MKKIVVSLELIGSILLTGVSTQAAGTGDDPTFTEDLKTVEQQKALEEKEATVNAMVSGIQPYGLIDGVYKTLAVPSYKQETNYWCGPATVKQVLGFLNSSSSSQSTYATALGTTKDGTDFTKIDDVLNKYQSKNNYVYASIGDYGSWSNKIDYSLNKNYPAVLDLKISPSYMPKYKRILFNFFLEVNPVIIIGVYNDFIHILILNNSKN